MLRVEGLRSGYGPLEVLHGLDLTVADGSFVAILGANGAGKSTLMRTLVGLVAPRGGHITYGDRIIDHASPERRLRAGLALVPEGRELFRSLSVRENLMMGAFTRPGGRSMEEDIARILDYFPRLKQRLTAAAASLSGGEGQMLAIGRAMMAHPRVLLLDEPSHGLAPTIVDTVFAVISQLHQRDGLTVVVAEQNAKKALSVAQRAYVLQGGTIALSGTAAELAQTAAVRELYLGG